MCWHTPRCPDADASDREAARTIRRDYKAGCVVLCNGVVHFDDTGDLLPDGRIVQPHRPTPLPRAAA